VSSPPPPPPPPFPPLVIGDEIFTVNITFTTSLDIADVDASDISNRLRNDLIESNVVPISVEVTLTPGSTVVNAKANLASEPDANNAKTFFDGLASSGAAGMEEELGIPVTQVGEVSDVVAAPVSPPPPPAPSAPPPADEDDANNLETFWLLLLLLLLFPLFFYIYARCRFGPQAGDYFKYSFSHSNPYIILFYMPAERRKELGDSLFRSTSSSNTSADLPKGARTAGAPGPSSFTPKQQSGEV
jgi:hypothetical protein